VKAWAFLFVFLKRLWYLKNMLIPYKNGGSYIACEHKVPMWVPPHRPMEVVPCGGTNFLIVLRDRIVYGVCENCHKETMIAEY
jgi:hypothetical protein